MRNAVLLLVCMMLAGCATPAPPPVQWAFKDALNVPKKDQCDTSASQVNPVLGDLKAWGLEPHMMWLPGMVDKINWDELTQRQEQMEVELRRAGSNQLAYRRQMNSGPSLVALPEPGCWDLTVRTKAKSATTRVYLEGARPVGLALPKGGNDPEPAFEWRDPAVALQLLDAAAASAVAQVKGRKSAELSLVWQAEEAQRVNNGQRGRWDSPMLYLPGSQGEAAQVVLQKSLITGDCRDAATQVAAAIKPELATQIEKQLSSHWVMDDSLKHPWRQSGECTPFEKVGQ